MAISFKYWDDCIDPKDMEAMWMDPDVSTEWINAGETRGQKVHLSRDPDGQPFLTQTEMKDMICAIAELESDRQPLEKRYNRKTKETTMGVVQLVPKTAEWLFSEMGYRTYEIEGDPTLLYRPFINVYFGAAYLKWLSSYDQKERNEEFVVRAYKGGIKKATHKSTLDYWRRYLSVKQSLPYRRHSYVGHSSRTNASAPAAPVSVKTGDAWAYWDTRASPEDMEELWKHPDVLKEWAKSRERKGQVRFSHDAEKRPYLSRIEVMAVAEIIISKHFSSRSIKPTILSALADISSMRFVNGVGSCTGIMGIDFRRATWLYKDLGYKAYKVHSVEDLSNPFASMYFGAAYLSWLSEYEGRKRSPQFIVQAFLRGPENINLQETGTLWVKFEEVLSYYEHTKKEHGNCSIL
ncbi:PREDICTED: uncharacterized protein LOC104599645 isoform X2 [Nelumbo nucifera]|uniref:Uncharacterized protein LOC104599645 isoform X2 n=1 Tax=Nelumbo nucifera TaxID=4432 RepID=A0A1U8A0W6_NELNU|nr:PREDICTED: uncharacterized protein LOC104599645 isoform X2 [Nelumbo nucifera]